MITQVENDAVISVVQAFLGLAQTGIRGIAVTAEHDSVDVYIAVGPLSESLREDVDDMIGELEAVYPLSTTISAHLFEGDPWDDAWAGRRLRLVFMEKPPVDRQMARADCTPQIGRSAHSTRHERTVLIDGFGPAQWPYARAMDQG